MKTNDNKKKRQILPQLGKAKMACWVILPPALYSKLQCPDRERQWRKMAGWPQRHYLLSVISFPNFPAFFFCRMVCERERERVRRERREWDKNSRVPGSIQWVFFFFSNGLFFSNFLIITDAKWRCFAAPFKHWGGECLEREWDPLWDALGPTTYLSHTDAELHPMNLNYLKFAFPNFGFIIP